MIDWSQLYSISSVLLLLLMRIESWPFTAWLLILIDTLMTFCAWACMNLLSSAIKSPHRFPPYLTITSLIIQTHHYKKWNHLVLDWKRQRRRPVTYQCATMPPYYLKQKSYCGKFFQKTIFWLLLSLTPPALPLI